MTNPHGDAASLTPVDSVEHSGGQAHAVTSTAVLRVAGAALTRSLGRLTAATRLRTAAIDIADNRIRFSFTENDRLTVIDVDAETEGSCHVAFAPRLLSNIAGALSRGEVRLSVRVDQIEIASGRSSFEIWCHNEPRSDVQPVLGGLRFDLEEQLVALRRIVTATSGARRSNEDVRIRFQSTGERLVLEFDTFEIAATDSVPRIDGELPEGMLVTSAEEFDDALRLFDDSFPRLRMAASSNGQHMWLAGTHHRYPVTVSTRVHIWQLETRDPARIQAGARPHIVRFRGRSIRSALRRAVISADGLGDGRYVWLRIGSRPRRIRVMMHGWTASAAEWVACTYDGPSVDIALRYGDLVSAIRFADGEIALSFGDPSKPVVIENGEAYRCVLRPLPSAVPGSAPHRTFFQNVPFPG